MMTEAGHDLADYCLYLPEGNRKPCYAPEGIRAGVEIRTPLGPVRLEEGVNSKGDWEGFVRTGTWF
jgi:hypothetical protein